MEDEFAETVVVVYLSAEDLEKIGMIEDSLGFKLSRSAVIIAGLQALLEKSEYRDQNKLRALEAAGVNNWEGYDDAMNSLKDLK